MRPPTLAVIGLLNFIGPFSEYLLARLVLLTPEKTTLAVGLHQFISNQYGQNWTQFAAGGCLNCDTYYHPVFIFAAPLHPRTDCGRHQG